jgi:hypothetical protein
MRRWNRRERGEGQLGCMVGLIFLLLAIFVAYKLIPVKVHAATFKQAIVDEAKSAGQHSDKQIMESLMHTVEEEKLPVTEDDITIERKQNNSYIVIDSDYTIPVKFPGYTYKWHFTPHAENPIF